MKNTLSCLKLEIESFSDNQFGVRNDPVGPLNHLKEEIIELIDAIGEVSTSYKRGLSKEEIEQLKHNEEEEWADCLLLLLDAFRIRYKKDVSFNKLLLFSFNKLEVIKKREWDKEPDENGVYHSKK